MPESPMTPERLGEIEARVKCRCPADHDDPEKYPPQHCWDDCCRYCPQHGESIFQRIDAWELATALREAWGVMDGVEKQIRECEVAAKKLEKVDGQPWDKAIVAVRAGTFIELATRLRRGRGE